MKRIFISNLSAETREDDLVELFSAHGKVRAIKMARDVFSGACRGFGTVDMEGHEARAAIAALDGRDFKGHPLRVKEEQPARRRR